MKVFLYSILMRMGLLMLAMLVRVRAAKRAEVQQLIDGKNLVIQASTADGKVGRYFVVQENKITSIRGEHPEPNIGISFENAAYMNSLLWSEERSNVLMTGIQQQKLRVIGDMSLLMWVINLLKALFK